MKLRRRILVLSVLVAVLIAAGLLTSRFWPGTGEIVETGHPEVELDSAQTVAWRKANPWLFPKPGDETDTARAAFRKHFLLPFAFVNQLEPRAVRRRGDFTELTFPRGRPVHTIALELERFAPRAGYVVLEGREVGNTADKVEYLLQAPSGRRESIRLVIGQTFAPGSFRMALVITELGRASAAERRAWSDFPSAVTLVYPDTLEVPGSSKEAEADSEVSRDILVELPMEPAAYPVVKPGPRALFIDDSRDETERILRERLELHSDAVGFATKLGDRAIESPGLMENVLTFAAERELIFLDLTGSPRSRTSQLLLSTGAEGFTAVAQEVGSEKILGEELLRRATAAQRSGEGVWVLRHTPGLPASLAKALRAQAAGDAAPRWVTLRQLRRTED